MQLSCSRVRISYVGAAGWRGMCPCILLPTGANALPKPVVIGTTDLCSSKAHSSTCGMSSALLRVRSSYADNPAARLPVGAAEYRVLPHYCFFSALQQSLADMTRMHSIDVFPGSSRLLPAHPLLRYKWHPLCVSVRLSVWLHQISEQIFS